MTCRAERLGAIALAAAIPALAAENESPLRACGTDYCFTVTPPPGWEYAADHPAGHIALTFTPPGKGAGDSGLIAITLGLGRASFRDDFDLDEVFERGVAGLAARGFRERVAVTYCWAAQRHALPRLAFVARETPRKKDAGPDTSSPIRLYSCEKRELGESHALEDFEYDPSVVEKL
jgi:hypothetical protein